MTTDERPLSDADAPRASWQLWRPRWSGETGRLEVWYATMTDAATGAGFWVHGETVASSSSGQGARAGGWAAWFPADGEPSWARVTGDDTVAPDSDHAAGFRCDGMVLDPEGTSGQAGGLEWELHWSVEDQEPLWTFPRWAWRRSLLPAAQVVPAPTMTATGWVGDGETRHEVQGHAQAARIYGHGNASRWGWLHADLGDGDVIELVSAVSTRPLLRALPPLAFLRLRVGGVEVSRPRLACWGLRSRLDLPHWQVRGRTQGLEVDVEVRLPEQRCVTIDYVDPDGSTATCTNSERADAVVQVTDQRGRRRRWELDGTAHAEIGRRP